MSDHETPDFLGVSSSELPDAVALPADVGPVRLLTEGGIVQDVHLRFKLTSDIFVWDVRAGGNGMVLLCARKAGHDPDMYLSMALKTVRLGREFSGPAIRRFKTECEVWFLNSHLGGVMPATEYFELDARPFVSMPVVFGQYTHGVNLRQYLRHRPFSRHAAAIVACFAAQGLALIERDGRRIVHGDIKPENFLMYQCLPMISDFGSAALYGDVPADGRFATRGYLPPEAELSGAIEHVTGDVWSFGRVLYDILRASDAPVRASTNYEKLSRRLQELCDGCLSSMPYSRPVGFISVHEELVDIAQGFIDLNEVDLPVDLHLGIALRETYKQFGPVFDFIRSNAGQIEALRAFGYTPEALSLSSSITRDSRVDPSATYARARALVDSGEFVEAKALLILLLERLDASEGHFEELRERAWNELGIVYRRLRRWDLAHRALLEAAGCAREQKHFIQAHINRAATYMDSGNEAEARTIFMQLMKLVPDDPEVLIAYAVMERQLGHLETARSVMQRASISNPANHAVHQLFAEILGELDAWSDCLLECDMALRTGATPREIGRLVLLVGRYNEEARSSATYRSIMSGAMEEQQQAWAREIDSLAGLVAVRRERDLKRAEDAGLLIARSELWVPESVQRDISPVAPRGEPAPPATWTDFDSAMRWFSKFRNGARPPSAEEGARLVSFAGLAMTESRYSDALDAAELLKMSVSHDNEGVPYSVRGRLLASLTLGQMGKFSTAWEEAIGAISEVEPLHVAEANLDVVDSAIAVAIQSSKGAPSQESVLNMFARQVRFRESAWGRLDERTLRSRHNYALHLDALERCDEAALEMEAVVRERRETLGYEDESTLNSTLMLCGIIGRAGDWQRATWLAEQAWQEILDVCGKDDPRYFIAIEEWAMCLAKSGKVDTATDLLRQALDQLDSSALPENDRGDLHRMLSEDLKEMLELKN
jgi:serine/threonine protein kinase